jgi:hypothetical protein
VLSTADTGLYIPFSRPGSWLRTLRNPLVQTDVHLLRPDIAPSHPWTLQPQTAYFPAAEASCGGKRRPARALGVLSSGVVNLHLQIDASALRDPAPCSRSLPRPPSSELARGLHPGRKQSSCCWWLVPRPRLFSHVRPLFVVRGSRQAKFADEVRINETHIKTGRPALMVRLNKVPSIRPNLRRDPSQLVFVTHSLTISHLLMRLILFIETRLQTLPCLVSPPIESRPGSRHYRV